MKSTHVAAVVAALFAAGAVAAQPRAPGTEYPARPVRLVSPNPPGGANDVIGRIVAGRLSDVLGVQMVVDNRGGAGGTIGGEIVAHANPDGYTLLAGSVSTHSFNPIIHKKLGYDPTRDLVPVAPLAAVPNIMIVHPSVPAKTLQELAKLARASPGKLNYASSGVGGSNHLASELFCSLAKVRMTHVPYKGVAIAMTAMLSGEVDVVVSTVPATIPHIAAGKLRGLLVLVLERVSVVP